MPSNLQKVSRLIWFLIGGGGLLFIACALFLAWLRPNTPADARISWVRLTDHGRRG